MKLWKIIYFSNDTGGANAAAYIRARTERQARSYFHAEYDGTLWEPTHAAIVSVTRA